MADDQGLTPISPMTLEDAAGKVEYRPQADITALEAAQANAMMLRLMLWTGPGLPDWRGFVAEHGLGRHFAFIQV